MEPMNFVPKSYSQAELAHMARNGSVADRITVVSRSYVSKETLQWLRENDDSDEIKTEFITRSDVTPEILTWASQTDNCNILGRIVDHKMTPLETVQAIRERADAQEGEVWTLLAQFASRIIKRRETGQSEFVIKGLLPDTEHRKAPGGS
jgi:hypothetical protein